MAELKGYEVGSSKRTVTLNVTDSEYELLKQSETNILLLPAAASALSEELTTGKLGNGNRIMLPNKILKKNNIGVLKKKLPSAVFEVEGRRYLLCKLDEKKPGVPVFGEEE